MCKVTLAIPNMKYNKCHLISAYVYENKRHKKYRGIPMLPIRGLVRSSLAVPTVTAKFVVESNIPLDSVLNLSRTK